MLNFTGIDSSYEEPLNPELTLETEKQDVEENEALMALVCQRVQANRIYKAQDQTRTFGLTACKRIGEDGAQLDS